MKIEIKKITERIKNIIEQIFINRAFKEVTICQKVTKFTDIFWKLAVYRLIRIKFRNVTVKGNKMNF
jgi:hypothetical protein